MIAVKQTKKNAGPYGYNNYINYFMLQRTTHVDVLLTKYGQERNNIDTIGKYERFAHKTKQFRPMVPSEGIVISRIFC